MDSFDVYKTAIGKKFRVYVDEDYSRTIFKEKETNSNACDIIIKIVPDNILNDRYEYSLNLSNYKDEILSNDNVKNTIKNQNEDKTRNIENEKNNNENSLINKTTNEKIATNTSSNEKVNSKIKNENINENENININTNANCISKNIRNFPNFRDFLKNGMENAELKISRFDEAELKVSKNYKINKLNFKLEYNIKLKKRLLKDIEVFDNISENYLSIIHKFIESKIKEEKYNKKKRLLEQKIYQKIEFDTMKSVKFNIDDMIINYRLYKHYSVLLNKFDYFNLERFLKEFMNINLLCIEIEYLASKDGFDISDLFRRIENKSNIMIVIKDELGEKFGVYIEFPLKRKIYREVSDKDMRIFRLSRNDDLVKSKNMKQKNIDENFEILFTCNSNNIISVVYHNHEVEYLYFSNKDKVTCDNILIFSSNSSKDEGKINYFKMNNFVRKDFKICEMEAYTIYKS